MIALTHELITWRILMNKLLIATMSLAALGLVFAATNGANAAQKSASSKYECFTDDGYGRKLPCSYGFKLAKRAAWAAVPHRPGSSAAEVKHEKDCPRWP